MTSIFAELLYINLCLGASWSPPSGAGFPHCTVLTTPLLPFWNIPRFHFQFYVLSNLSYTTVRLNLFLLSVIDRRWLLCRVVTVYVYYQQDKSTVCLVTVHRPRLLQKAKINKWASEPPPWVTMSRFNNCLFDKSKGLIIEPPFPNIKFGQTKICYKS